MLQPSVSLLSLPSLWRRRFSCTGAIALCGAPACSSNASTRTSLMLCWCRGCRCCCCCWGAAGVLRWGMEAGVAWVLALRTSCTSALRGRCCQRTPRGDSDAASLDDMAASCCCCCCCCCCMGGCRAGDDDDTSPALGVELLRRATLLLLPPLLLLCSLFAATWRRGRVRVCGDADGVLLTRGTTNGGGCCRCCCCCCEVMEVAGLTCTPEFAASRCLLVAVAERARVA